MTLQQKILELQLSMEIFETCGCQQYPNIFTENKDKSDLWHDINHQESNILQMNMEKDIKKSLFHLFNKCVINKFASGARIIFLICQCHTVTNGTDLRRSPLKPERNGGMVP